MRQIRAAVFFLAAAGLLTGCVGRPAVMQPSVSPESGGADAVKTGLSLYASAANSRDASAGAEGSAQAEIQLAAVTVDADGVIVSCVLDQIKSQVTFDHSGQLTGGLDGSVPSKRELGGSYGMAAASSIGREWDQQAAAMAEYACGKTVAQLKGIAVNERGAPAQADLAASVTISVADFVAGIEAAVENAQYLGAQRGDQLTLAAAAGTVGSQDASADAEGLAQTQVTAAAVTFDGETITSCTIDAVQVDVAFSGAGIITTDLSASQPSKNQLGAAYGMAAASSIGREWDQQTAAFCAYVTGKTARETAQIAVDERTRPTEPDLTASVTIAVGEFQALIEKAAENR